MYVLADQEQSTQTSDEIVMPMRGDMNVEEFRHYGHQVIDWVTGYAGERRPMPILSQMQPGTLNAIFEQQVPIEPEPMQKILQDFERLIVPGITHWNSGGFLGYFGLSASGPSILGDTLDAALNVTRMLWHTSPAATELEQITLDWLRRMLGLPYPLFGMLYHNSAILQALAAAREAIPYLHIRQKGLAGRKPMPRLRIYASKEAHASIDKAAIVLGIGQEGLCKIGTDSLFRMNVEELERTILQDIRAGWLPFAVVATVGTTSTTSIDPVPQIATICERYGLWLHVDAAYAGAAAIVPSMRWVLAGCEQADSLTINPHKWLFTSFGSSILYTRRPDVLKAALSITPDYLQGEEGNTEEAENLMDYDYALPHRFPALKLWMVMRYFGQRGLASRISEHCEMAQRFAQWVDKAPNVERMAPTLLSVVCFRVHPGGIDNDEQLDSLNARILQRVNGTGKFFLSHTRIHNRYALRMAIGNIHTTGTHIQDLWSTIQAASQAELGVARGRWPGDQRGAPHMLSLPTRAR
jgi:aromatic-L-amino-acid/L-tryptophan decarboxylase